LQEKVGWSAFFLGAASVTDTTVRRERKRLERRILKID
jgi:hypothetical protein